MKTELFILLAALCYVECRKIMQVDQHANTAVINMEEGGPPKQPAKAAPVPAPAPAKPTPAPAKQILTPAKPTTAPVKPVENQPPVTPAKPNVPVQPAKAEPTKPGVNSAPAYSPFPVSGSVKSLVNFFDSQGKHSVIFPYSFADSVKQWGKSRNQLSFTDDPTAVFNIDCRACRINLYISVTKPPVDV